MARLPFSGLDSLASPGTIAIPDNYQRIQTEPGAFGSGDAKALEGFGQKLEQAGGTAMDIATQQQQIWNQSTLTNAFTKLRDQVTNASWGDPSDPNSRGFLTRTGSDALNGYDGAMKGLQRAQSDIRQTLTPQQQVLFDRQSGSLLSATRGTYDQHRATQQVAWANSSSDASARSAQSAAIAAPDDDTFLHNMENGRNDILSKASRLGWSPEVIGQQLAEYTSQARLGATERLANVNPQTAWAYYQQHQRDLTGQDSLALEGKLRPALMAWGARDEANRLLGQGGYLPGGGRTGGGGVANAPLVPAIASEAQRQGVSPGLALTTARIESDFGRTPDRPGSQFQGPFQMGDAAWAARGGTAADRNDQGRQVELGIANLKHSQAVASQATGQPAEDWQAYLVHQQGDAGGPALLRADPGQSAVAALAPAYKGNSVLAARAITQNGGTANMTAGQFLGVWQARYAHLQQQAPASAGSTGPAAPSGPDPAPANPALPPVDAATPEAMQGTLATLRMRQADPEGTAPDVPGPAPGAPAGAAPGPAAGAAQPAQGIPVPSGAPAAAGQPAPGAPAAAGAPAPASTAPAAGASPAATGKAALRQNLPALMEQAARSLDPFGQANPQFTDQVQSRLRAKVNEIEYADREAEKANRDTLLNAAMGAPPTGVVPAAGSAPAPVPPRPTSLDQMLQDPAARAAWTAATPETQRGILQLIEHNSHGQDPPMTPAAQGLFYQLSGMAVNSREDFQKLDLSDPKYTGALPHSYWNTLAAEQRRFGNADVATAGREASQARALTVLKPDLLAAGIKVDGLKPGTTAATTYDQFVGRLREGLDQFQQDNKRRPTDAEVGKLGQGLLLQGTQRGTASSVLPSFLGGGERNVRAFQVEAGQFAPTVPPDDRKGIVAAYQARHGGTAPTEGQVQEVWMVGRQHAMQPRRPGQNAAAVLSNPDPAGNRPTTPNPFAPAAPAAAPPKAGTPPAAGLVQQEKPDLTRGGRVQVPAAGAQTSSN